MNTSFQVLPLYTAYMYIQYTSIWYYDYEQIYEYTYTHTHAMSVYLRFKERTVRFLGS